MVQESIVVQNHRIVIFFERNQHAINRFRATYLFVMVDSDNIPLNLHAEHDVLLAALALRQLDLLFH